MRDLMLGLVGAIVLSLPGITEAQSLADVARAAQTRSQEATATQPAKVYTNNDLAKVPDAPTPVAPVDPLPSTAESAPAAPAASSREVEAPEKTESYWRERMRPLLEQLARDRALAAASQSRAEALAAEADRCFRLGVVCAQYAESLREQAESDRLRADVERSARAVSALQEEGRRAGIPPGWLRP